MVHNCSTWVMVPDPVVSKINKQLKWQTHVSWNLKLIPGIAVYVLKCVLSLSSTCMLFIPELLVLD